MMSASSSILDGGMDSFQAGIQSQSSTYLPADASNIHFPSPGGDSSLIGDSASMLMTPGSPGGYGGQSAGGGNLGEKTTIFGAEEEGEDIRKIDVVFPSNPMPVRERF
jgi:hypothetical protein